MDSALENLLFKKLCLSGYLEEDAQSLVSYLVDASNDQLDSKEYYDFLKLITKSSIDHPSPNKVQISQDSPEILKYYEDYSRDDIHAFYFGTGYPRVGSGNWTTGYVQPKGSQDLIIFMNIGITGKTGHDFKNSYDKNTGTIKWFGKPRSHSKQPTFVKLFSGELTPHFFARWDPKKVKFRYLGSGSIIDYKDGMETSHGVAIMLNIKTFKTDHTILK